MSGDGELEEVLRIAREASDLVRAIYATPFAVEMKGPGDPVTRADREANDLICRQLAASFPGDAIIAEESVPGDASQVEALARHERVFYVDPLDGTREFADRNGEFAVMIGLAVRGAAELGVVVMPTTGEAQAGRVSRAGSAFTEDASRTRRSLRVSGEARPEAAGLMVSRSRRPPLIEALTAKLGIARVIPCGSVGVKVARLTTGEADLYVHDGGGAKRWDTCAPDAILTAAGGRFTDLDGRAVDYASADLVLQRGMLASNGHLHAPVMDALRELGASAPR